MTQESIPDSETWFTPLLLVITFSKDKVAVVPIAVEGKQSPVRIKLPGRPQKVELDPDFGLFRRKHQ